MEITKLKATMQLAKMRFDADPTDENDEKYDDALAAYENALESENTEVENNDQVSGKKPVTAKPATPAKPADPKKPAATRPASLPKTVVDVVTPPVVEANDESGDTNQTDDTAEDQKKTEE